MKLDGRNTRWRLAVLGAVSLTLSTALYFASKGSDFNAISKQGAFGSSLLSNLKQQSATAGSYLHRAQEATSALDSLLEKDIELSDLAGKGQRVSELSTLLEAIIEDPTISRESFFRFRTHEFGWWRLRSETYLPWGDRGESTGMVMCIGQKNIVLAAQNIRTLRNVLGSVLPIDIFYAGEHDLPWGERKQLEDLAPNVRTVNVLDFYDDSVAGIGESLAENGWVMKPFAM